MSQSARCVGEDRRRLGVPELRAQIVWLGVPGCLYTCLITNMGDEEVVINQAARSLRNLVGIPLMHKSRWWTGAGWLSDAAHHSSSNHLGTLFLRFKKKGVFKYPD